MAADLTLAAEFALYNKQAKAVGKLCNDVMALCRPGASEDVLNAAAVGLSSLVSILQLLAHK
jgi:hypothetical protein